ncbi:integrin alpha-PS1-like, partial [Nilaparvata lugens]|uniref:integrin alpha-PS1-like n=1 Tax=Nilaparvata lugens TaxID=108931 RepID=UPI00193E90FE
MKRLGTMQGRSTNKAHEEYGYCQVGTSGVLVGDDTVVLGTPGPYTWRGTVFVLSASDNYLDRDKTFYMGPVTEPLAPVDKYSYLGMSVTAANSSAATCRMRPGHHGQWQGKVVLFSIAKRMHSTMNVNLVIDGEQFASSFGYEIATADVNGDLLPDLLVGAPFYFDRDVGGAIYIYLNNKERCLNCAKPTKMTGKPESRYGFAITNLGDINKDGYDDIAVGAPYETTGLSMFNWDPKMDLSPNRL